MVIAKRYFTNKLLFILFWLSLALTAPTLCYPADNSMPPTIAVIIDDLGHQKDIGERLINIPAPLTLAFLPMRQYSDSLARQAYRNGKEVMLHAPMENTRNFPLGAAGLSSNMSDAELLATFRQALQSVPYLSGVNNHMGSTLTQNQRAMNAIMKELQSYPLYFVDSRTTSLSVAHDTAKDHDIPSLNRDVFLDNDLSTSHIHAQFGKLIGIARKQGTAIAIGHPHLKTVRYLERMLPRLGKEGIAVATVKGIWEIRNSQQQQTALSQEHKEALLAKSREEALKFQGNW